jgi:hypothetical protein
MATLTEAEKEILNKALIEAARAGDENALRDALQGGADVNAVDEEYRGTALCWAAYANNVDCIKALEGEGADLDKADLYGNTPLMQATTRDHTASVKLLLERGANRDLANKEGVTPRQHAELNPKPNSPEIFTMLSWGPQVGGGGGGGSENKRTKRKSRRRSRRNIRKRKSRKRIKRKSTRRKSRGKRRKSRRKSRRSKSYKP